MATADSVKAKMQGLIDSANAKTGGNDTTLTGAVSALIAGFGQGGGSSGGTLLERGEITLVDNVAYFDITLEKKPDLVVMYADKETIGALSMTAGALVGYFPMMSFLSVRPTTKTDAYSNFRVSLRALNGNFSNSGENDHYLLDANGEYSAHFVRISSSYPLGAITYRWESYKLWGV